MPIKKCNKCNTLYNPQVGRCACPEPAKRQARKTWLTPRVTLGVLILLPYSLACLFIIAKFGSIRNAASALAMFTAVVAILLVVFGVVSAGSRGKNAR